MNIKYKKNTMVLTREETLDYINDLRQLWLK